MESPGRARLPAAVIPDVALTLHFSCWAYGSDVNSIFRVDIPSTEIVTDLKKAIYDNVEHDFRNVNADALILYSASAPDDDEELKKLLNDWTLDGKSSLRAESQLSDLNLSDDLIIIDALNLSTIQSSTGMTFNCCLCGNDTNRIFQVKLRDTDTVADLKNAIKNRKLIEFCDVDADALVLFVVPAPNNDDELNKCLKEWAQSGKLYLWPLRQLSDLNPSNKLIIVDASSLHKTRSLAISLPTTFNCWVLGDDTNRIFRIETWDLETVTSLKEEIRMKRWEDLRKYKADSLALYKVSIPSDDCQNEVLHNLSIDQDCLLLPYYTLADVSADLKKNHLHIVVRVPPPNPKVAKLKVALGECDPFYTGTCAVPYHQRLLYYTHNDLVNCIDFSDVEPDQLNELYHACQPAEFGRGNENVFDESYRKAREMDLASFSTLFDPYRLGIYEQVFKSLHSEGNSTIEMELHKLNIYGEGDFSKPHKDMPRRWRMFGSLVVVFPTPHEGGQLVLRQGKKEWTIDSADKFMTAQEFSVRFVAFYGDVEHEILPVTSGHRITLTYNLHHAPFFPRPPSTLTSYQLMIKQALVDLVNERSILPNGGYLGFGLELQYAHENHKPVELLLTRLKGPDRALAEICEALDLDYSLKLLYRDFGHETINLITSAELEIDPLKLRYSPTVKMYLEQALKNLTVEQAEFVSILEEEHSSWWAEFADGRICRNPISELMEITEIKYPFYVESPIIFRKDEFELLYARGIACLLIYLDPADEREMSEL